MEKEINKLKRDSAEMTTQWEKEKSLISEIRRLKAEIENMKIEEQKAERNGDLNVVAEIRHPEKFRRRKNSLKEKIRNSLNSRKSKRC